VTALADALEASGHLPPPPFHKRPERSSDPQLAMHYWNHSCPRCTTWVPNHRTYCMAHEEKEEAA
jgi:hypothetical protein